MAGVSTTSTSDPELPVITTATLETMTDFAMSGLPASEWSRTNKVRRHRDVVLPIQAIMAEVERIWGPDFQADLVRSQTPSGVRLHRDRMYLGELSRTPVWRYAATAAWLPSGFLEAPQAAPRIELRLGYGFWEMGFAFTTAGRPSMVQMARNLLPNRQVLKCLLEPLLGGSHFQWCTRVHQRMGEPAGHGIIETWDSYAASDIFDGVTGWDRLISATTADAWDTLPSLDGQRLIDLIVRMVRRVYPLIILTTAADSEMAVHGIENYLTLLAQQHPEMLPVRRDSKVIQFPGGE